MRKPIFSIFYRKLLCILDIIFPNFCLGCGKKMLYGYPQDNDRRKYFCKSCEQEVYPIDQRRCCKKCGYPFTPIRLSKGNIIRNQYELQQTKIICQSCDTINFAFNKAFSCFQYQGKIRKLLLNFKFYFQTEIIDFIGTSLIYVYKNIKPANIVCCIPITQKKLFIKGYNHSALMAKIFYKNAKKTDNNIIFLPDLLIKKKVSVQSKTLTQQERWRKKHNFAINSKYLTNEWKQKLQSKTILIIDDIMTTGATLNSASFILKDNFYNIEINCLTFARTMLY